MRDKTKSREGKLRLKKARKIGQSGFTIIELLVVISVMTLISSILMTSIVSARRSGRDAKRIADLNQLAKAFELFYSDNQYYPHCSNPGYPGGCDLTDFLFPGSGVDSSLDNRFVEFLVPKYISRIPLDPINSLAAGHFYAFTGYDSELVPGSGQHYSYVFGTILEDVKHPQLKDSISASIPLYAGFPFYGIGMAK